MSAATTSSTGRAPSRTQSTVRRLVVYVLLFVLVATAAGGLSGLLARLLGEGAEFAGTDVTGLALSLAFTLIAGPLAALLWWVVWRRADTDTERSALSWGLYVSAMYIVALVTATVSLLSLLADAVAGQPQGWQSNLSTGFIWAAVWLWHLWMSRHRTKGPLRLHSVPRVIGAAYGLLIAVANGIGAIAGVLDAAVRALADATTVGGPWWTSVLGAAAWAVGGAAIWWWHWMRQSARNLRGGLADVVLLVVGILLAAALALGGMGTVLFVLLRLALDRTDPIVELVGPLPMALAAGAIGLLVWAYHHPEAESRGQTTSLAARLVVSAVALVGAATGIGVVVNSLMALAATPLAGADARTLLLGGISALLVGAPIWWIVWRPAAAADPAGRRVYLVAVFGVSAVVALVTLLVIGFRLFEFLLDDVTGSSLLERIRAPFGLLAATCLVAAYHFGLWRRDRSTLAVASEAGSSGDVAGIERISVERVVLVVSHDDGGALASTIREATGARVTVWVRGDTADGAQGSLPDGAALVGELVGRLTGVSARRVLVLVDADDSLEVIPIGAEVG